MSTHTAPTRAAYRALRKQIGTQQHVAELLGISPTALGDRERGDSRITAEMMLALERLHDLCVVDL